MATSSTEFGYVIKLKSPYLIQNLLIAAKRVKKKKKKKKRVLHAPQISPL
jgi:hypothetical protein